MPFMDHEVVEFLWTLSPELLVRKGVRKWILREAVGDLLPDKVRTRHWKVGFDAPEERWLRGPLKELVLDTLCCSQLKTYSFLDWEKVRVAVQGFYDNQTGLTTNRLWRWLNFELWMREFMNGRGLT